MSLTRTTIISNALLQLGHAPISSLTSGDKLVVAADAVFDQKLNAVFSRSNWRFATQIQQLSQSTETPPPQYKTIYLLPAGYVKMLRLYPNIYDWDIYAEGKVYTNYQGALYMEYVYVPDVSQWPGYFSDYYSSIISMTLALSNAQKTEYYPALKQDMERLQSIAMALDCQNRPQFSQVDIPVLNRRMVSDYDGYGFVQ
jgi:hypothetical protein